jgi:hypothetical protein
MKSKSFIKSGQPVEAQIVGLQKQALEKPSWRSLQMMEEAYFLASGPDVPTKLQVYTALNLSNLYVKARKTLDALKVLTDQLGLLNALKDFIWEKALVLAGIANIKSLLGSHDDALYALTMCLELLRRTKNCDRNYYTVLVTVYYNCFIESSNVEKYEQGMRFLALGRQIALKRLGVESSMYKFLSSYKKEDFFEDTIEVSKGFLIGSLRNRLTPVQERSKSNTEKNYLAGKDESGLALTPVPVEKSRNKLWMYYRGKLSDLVEEDEEIGTARSDVEKNETGGITSETYRNKGNSKKMGFKFNSLSHSGPVVNKPSQVLSRDNYQEYLKKIIKIQSFFREVLARKKHELENAHKPLSLVNMKSPLQIKTLQSRVRDATKYGLSVRRTYLSKKMSKTIV